MSRAEQAKINGAKSNGPKTEAGKAISSQNALHFGLNASQVIIGGEDPAEFEELLADLSDTYCPGSLVEFDLVCEMAAARWRLRRLPKMEQAAHYAALARVKKEPGADTLTPEELEMKVWNAVTESSEMKQIHRHETRLRRAWEKARMELDALINERLLAERHAENEARVAQLVAESDAQVAALRARTPKPQPAPEPAPARTVPASSPALRSVQNEPETHVPQTRAA